MNRLFIAAAALALGASGALAAGQTTLKGVVYGTAPSGSALVDMRMWCVDTTTPANCSPYHLLWDGTTVATVNGDGGLSAHVMNWPSSFGVTGTFWQSVQPVSWSGQSVGLTGTLPAFAATPTVNLGTLNGAATAAGQSTEHTDLAAILTADQTTATAMGVGGSGITQPTGGLGLLGWLSGIFSRLAPPIHVTIDSGGNAINNNITPSDTASNADGSPTWSQNALWDSIAAKWFRAPGNATNGAKVYTGAATIWSQIVPNSTTCTLVSSAARAVFGVNGTTNGSAPLYVKIYDTATLPTAGSGTPVMRVEIPVSSTAANGSGNNVPPISSGGGALTNGLGVCVTAGIADNDTTAPAANVAIVNLGWK